MTARDYTQWTVEQFWAVPEVTSPDGYWQVIPAGVTEVVVLPGSGVAEDLHESGFRNMGLALVKDGGVIGRTRILPDVLHFSPSMERRIEMDCLPVSGLLRIWSDGAIGRDELVMSSIHLRWAPTDRDIGDERQWLAKNAHADNHASMKRRMVEWAKAFGHDQLRVLAWPAHS